MKAKSQLGTSILIISIWIMILFSMPVILKDVKFNNALAYKDANSKTGSVKSDIITNKETIPEKKWLWLPVRLIIPNIRVNAKVEYVGLTEKWLLDTPNGIVNVAWYDRGPLPWDTGSSIIDGHFWWKRWQPAVFNDLNKLKSGDKIYIEDANRTIITFMVNQLKTYSFTDVAPEIFQAGDSGAHLNIITCHWLWDKSNKIYKSRLVVFADRIAE